MDTTTHLDMYMYITTHRVTTYTTEYSDNKYKKQHKQVQKKITEREQRGEFTAAFSWEVSPQS